MAEQPSGGTESRYGADGSPTADFMIAAHHQPKSGKRSSATCAPCRARKVRCDGKPDTCSNCDRLGFTCVYEDAAHAGAGAQSASALLLPRRRARQACLTCHARKARCSGHSPACERCRAQGIECVYRPSKRVRTAAHAPDLDDLGIRSPASVGASGHHSRDDPNHGSSDHGFADPAASTTPSTSNHDLSGQDDLFESLISRTFSNFFRHVHHIPTYSFLHRASLMQRYDAGRVDRPLLLALIGVTSILTDLGPGTREYGEKCVDESEALILRDLETASTIKVQTLVLIIKYRILSRRFSSAFMLAATASRFATALRLNYENHDLCFLAQESRRRLMWTLFMIDAGMAGGYKDLALWTPDSIRIRLPCNERNFEFDLPQETPALAPGIMESSSDDIGSLALHIRILWIRGRILQYTKTALATKGEDVNRLQTQQHALAKELEEFADRLPVSFRFSENSLRLRAYSPRLCVFIMIHVWWRQCHCDLYRLGLIGLREALTRPTADRLDPEFIAHCQRQCVEHALEMSKIFEAMRQLDHLPVSDLDMPVCAYQCARMLYYAYHINAEEFGLTPELLREKASLCLYITKGCCSGPAAASIQADLERLVANDLSAETTPSYADSPEPNRLRKGPAQQRNPPRQSAVKQVQLVDDPDTGAPAPDELTNRPFGIGAWDDNVPPAPSTKSTEQGREANEPVDANSLEVNNAFEGALESLDFNFEPMGIDSLAWFSSDWGAMDFMPTDI